MVARSDCVSAIKAASGDALTDQEALDVLEAVQRRRERLEAAGTIDRVDARLRQLAAEDADRARLMAVLQQKHAVLSARARNRSMDAVLTRMQDGMSYRNAVLSLLEGDANHRNSVAATILSYEARYIGGLMGRIAKEKPHIEKRLGDNKLMSDAVRLMFGETVANADPDARYLSDLFAEYLELSRVDANALGANIGKLAGYVPQAHVDWRLLRTDVNEWIAFIKPLLDFDKTFPDVEPEAVDGILRGVYDTITQGREVEAPSGFKAPRNFANAMEQHRVLHFANADAFMAYNEQFGFGNLFAIVQSHMRRMAKNNAVMDKLGPNPGVTLDNLLGALIERVRNDTALKPDKKARIGKLLQSAQSGAERERGGAIGAAYRIVSGYADTPGDWSLAKAGATLRGVQSLSKLGGATLTAVPTDLATLTLNLNYHGRNYWQSLGDSLRNVVRGRGKGEQRAVAYLLGEGFDGVVGHFTARYGDLDTIPGRMSRMMEKFFRWNQLTGWTDTVRAAGARIMAADMGRLSGRTWDKLPAKYRRVLQIHEIDAAQWEIIRSTAWKGDSGRRYVTPDMIDALPPEAFDGLIQQELTDIAAGAKPGVDIAPRINRSRQDARRNLSIALRRFYADEGLQNVVEVDASTKRWATGGTRPGTLGGETIRTLLQFRSFPLAFTRRILGRAIFGSSGRERTAGMAKLVLTLAAAGYLSQAAKDLTRGLGPKDPTRPETIAQALLQSGAAGLYGDFLFNIGGSRFGNTALETAAGPTVTTLADIVNIYQRVVTGDATQKEVFDSIWSTVPFGNIWYARTAMDMLILNEARELMSPGYLRRRARFTKEKFGQESVLPLSVWR